MPVNHFILPLEWNGKFLFSELWVDPDAGRSDENGQRKKCTKMLFKIDVQPLGAFDVLLVSVEDTVGINVFCPEKIAPFSERIGQALGQILTRNGLKNGGVSVMRMQRPLTLTEVFPKIFERKNSVNVKV